MLIKKLFYKYQKVLIILLGIVIVAFSPMMPIELLLVTAGAVILITLYDNAKFGVAIMMMILPFANHEIFRVQPISAIPLKLIVIVFLALFGLVFIRYRMNFRTSLDSINIGIFILYLFIFMVAVLKASNYIGYVSLAWNDDLSMFRLVSNFLVTPIILIMPAIIILFYFNYEDTPMLINAFISGVALLSSVVLFLYIFYVGDKTNFSTIRRELGGMLGLHGNNMADFYIVSFPLLLVVYMNDTRMFVKVSFFMSLMTIGLLFSRTAYVCVVLTFLAYSFYRGRFDRRFVGLLLSLAIVVLILPEAVYDRFLTLGRDGSAGLNELTAGRTEDIWRPLWLEWLLEPMEIKLFGKGRFSIVETFAYRNGIVLRVNHPHNMFFEAMTDIGVFGLLAYLTVYGYYVMQATVMFIDKNTDQYDRDILFGILLSIALYFLSGLSGRTMFPASTNAYSWVMVMFSVLLVRHRHEETSRWKEIVS